MSLLSKLGPFLFILKVMILVSRLVLPGSALQTPPEEPPAEGPWIEHSTILS